MIAVVTACFMCGARRNPLSPPWGRSVSREPGGAQEGAFRFVQDGRSSVPYSLVHESVDTPSERRYAAAKSLVRQAQKPSEASRVRGSACQGTQPLRKCARANAAERAASEEGIGRDLQGRPRRRSQGQELVESGGLYFAQSQAGERTCEEVDTELVALLIDMDPPLAQLNSVERGERRVFSLRPMPARGLGRVATKKGSIRERREVRREANPAAIDTSRSCKPRVRTSPELGG